MVWVSIDGLEGAGKTTLADALVTRFEDALVLPEFSNSFAGRALSAAVVQSPHFISVSGIAQSLFFLAEFIEKIEEAAPRIRSSRKLVISDRGWLSKIVYQRVVLDPLVGEKRARALLELCLVGLPRPDLTIWLRVDSAVAKMRLLSRGSDRNRADLDFMERAAEQFELLAHEYAAVLVDTTAISSQQVCDSVCWHLRTQWPLFIFR